MGWSRHCLRQPTPKWSPGPLTTAEIIAAVKTCLDAICGDNPAKVARAALVRVADEAGIPVIAVVH